MSNFSVSVRRRAARFPLFCKEVRHHWSILFISFTRSHPPRMSSAGVAFVTGASQGIGREIALRLADDGLDIAVNDIPNHKAQLDVLCQEISAKGRKASAQVGDVALESDVESMIASIVKTMGELNVVRSVPSGAFHRPALTFPCIVDGRQRRHLHCQTNVRKCVCSSSAKTLT
jgi:nucleoside-diphosphate-sugar epimerase